MPISAPLCLNLLLLLNNFEISWILLLNNFEIFEINFVVEKLELRRVFWAPETKIKFQETLTKEIKFSS